ncbi:bisanhydrobacterioruberin hydratase [Halosimplex halophilum]|uniref:bisanhydrobacterioruberin hydratase n=1 Tax=Halosimplex halophilum TaxID=2559572 RepID=UPI00107F4409|nr:bisanhydrobacterioruberin hydratase [Halosimplex halophilum]
MAPDWVERAGLPASGALDRDRVEARLDGLVRRNRFTIAVVFPVTGAVLLLASALGWFAPAVGALPPAMATRLAWLPDALAFNPWLVLVGVVVMRLPLAAGVAPLVDRRATAALLALAAYAYGIEFVGVSTGWPYGAFEYGVALGPMLGGVPLALPVFFFPLVLNSYLLCLLLLGDLARSPWVRLPVVVATVVGIDLVLDPGAVALGFWTYDGGGAFYGVPWSNYAGWVLSAAVAVAAFDWGLDREALLARLDACPFMLDDMVSFVILWGGVNAAFGNWLPVALAGLFGLGLAVTDRFDVPTRPRWAE